MMTTTEDYYETAAILLIKENYETYGLIFEMIRPSIDIDHEEKIATLYSNTPMEEDGLIIDYEEACEMKGDFDLDEVIGNYEAGVKYAIAMLGENPDPMELITGKYFDNTFKIDEVDKVDAFCKLSGDDTLRELLDLLRDNY